MRHLKVLLLAAAGMLYSYNNALLAQTAKDSSVSAYKATVIQKDNPIVAALDSLALLKCFEPSGSTASNKDLNIYNYAAGYVPVFSDSVYTLRIAKLNAKSPFGLVYNEDVKGFIDLYAVKKRQMTCRILGLAQFYFPLFEEYLDKYHIPLELKYLAVVESALNPVAKSPAGANGLWQFIYSTGKMYNMGVTSYVDDRFDPVTSTIAACRHFKDLYAIYKDWSLVLAAYNSGPGNVNKAIRKANGEMDFWKIKKYLPRETQGYVPAFIAVTYVMNYPSEHNLYPVAPKFSSYEIDTVTVKKKLTFDQISEALNIPKDEIEYLNPTYKDDVIPAFADDVYSLRLQKKYIGDFMTNETSLYAYKTKAMLAEEKILADKQKEIKKKDSLLALKQYTYKKSTTTAVTNNDSKTTSTAAGTVYTVKSGDGLGIIASKYGCTISQIQSWNKLATLNIYPGQKLYVQDPVAVAAKTDSNVAKTEVKSTTTTQTTTSIVQASKTSKYVYHTVQKGDTLWGIANKYKGVTVEEIKSLNSLTNASMLYVGQKLKVAVAS